MLKTIEQIVEETGISIPLKAENTDVLGNSGDFIADFSSFSSGEDHLLAALAAHSINELPQLIKAAEDYVKNCSLANVEALSAAIAKAKAVEVQDA